MKIAYIRIKIHWDRYCTDGSQKLSGALIVNRQHKIPLEGQELNMHGQLSTTTRYELYSTVIYCSLFSMPYLGSIGNFREGFIFKKLRVREVS